MFTEGLDESAINWIKQGSDADQRARSPLTEKLTLDSDSEPAMFSSKNYRSPQILPPLKLYSGLPWPGSRVVGFEDDVESVASVQDDTDFNYSDTCEEEGLGSSDSDLFEKPITRDYDEELFKVKSSTNFRQESVNGSNCRDGSSLIRGFSKDDLRIEVPTNGRRLTDGDFSIRGDIHSISGDKYQTHEQFNIHSAHDHLKDEATPQTTPQHLPELGTPSAPPIVEFGKEIKSELEDTQLLEEASVKKACSVSKIEQASNEMYISKARKDCYVSMEALSDQGTQSQKSNETCARSISGEAGVQHPFWQTNSVDQPTCHNTSGQNAWQTLIAYDACFRLCLHAWARGCMEAPEFLQDECLVMRNAFGLQKFLLQPRGQIPKEGRPVDSAEETCAMKPKKVVGNIRVEVRKIRIIPRRKLRTTYSHRGALYMQAGVEYVRHVSALLKTGASSLKITSFGTNSEEALSCFFQLKSSAEETQEPGSVICLQPGTGDSHVFLPESQGDALLVEVQDTNRIIQGRAIIQVSSLTDNPSDKVRWWPIFHDDQECVGKVQLSISSTSTCGEINSIKSGPVVETHAYDLVLEAALRAQHFHQRNLRLYGPWKWLLTEFADYYGVTDAYTKLRYISYIMNVATPTKACLELIHELLMPVVKARSEKILTRQERSILLDCETQVDNLLANVFVNYKSLDEHSPTGLEDLFVPASGSAAPALVPAVQVYTLLHDILVQEGQITLKNYLRAAAKKRCRRQMVDTDEFMSSNYDGFLTDPMTTSMAYLKMKTLCTNIRNEIQADIKIHNQHILPSSIDLPNLAATVYSTELCNRLRGFLAACPPSSPLPHVTELLIATADFERDLQSWSISQVNGGVDARNLFHHYIMVWVQDKRLYLLDLCKAEKAPWSGVTTHHSTSPFVEDMYEKIKDTLNEYEVVINRWPEYSLILENAIADVERAVIKAMEKQYSEILTPLKDSIPKKLGMHVQKLARRQSTSLYHAPNQLGIFLNTVKRILDILHVRVEDVLKSWASYLPVIGDRKSVFGEQLNGITVMLRTKYKNYMQATVEKLISNTHANRVTRLKKILEETKEVDGEVEIRERMQMLTSQIMDSICNLHDVFSGRIFVAVCRGFWDRMGQIVLNFLESRKENRIWYKGSYYALGVLDDTFASEMQRFQGNALQEKDLEPPCSVTEARSILCRDTPNRTDPSTYFYY
ncbi:portal protein isoform X2 [Tasmannia lanceolata]|uniref:portal protein isoform X2 n=1 Tax=Tasmannia lanceolata TaxID=3420 RepID=UPI004063AC85